MSIGIQSVITHRDLTLIRNMGEVTLVMNSRQSIGSTSLAFLR